MKSLKDMQSNGSKHKKIKLKYLFVCAVLVACTTACAAQIKVIEKSAKKAPAWVNGVEKNFLIVSATAQDVEAAKEKILNSIREQVVHAVAVNVKSAAAINVQETVLDGKVRQFLETTGTTIYTKSGNVPFLSEIALSNAVDYYWEKQQNKKTKAVTIAYHVKYPFPEIQLQQLVFEFKEADEKMTAQLTALCESAGDITNVEDIGKNITALQQLQKFFDDGRKEQAAACVANYRNLYTCVSLEESGRHAGHLSYRLMLGGKPAVAIQKPRVKSNCADNISVKTYDNGSAGISYQTGGCYAGLDNYIEVTYNFGGKNVSQKFFFTVEE
ncbi:MAG: hypothetical protein LBD52_04330 [Prevotellaceae bacterium]|jgi:hypothetical protein|nr:hypothetical protein [Prevotellaceae bacterium]